MAFDKIAAKAWFDSKNKSACPVCGANHWIVNDKENAFVGMEGDAVDLTLVNPVFLVVCLECAYAMSFSTSVSKLH